MNGPMTIEATSIPSRRRHLGYHTLSRYANSPVTFAAVTAPRVPSTMKVRSGLRSVTWAVATTVITAAINDHPLTPTAP